MRRYAIVALVTALVMSGCAVTQHDAMMQMRPLYEQQAAAHAKAVKTVMDALQKVQRGGMSVELDENGRVKKINYTEHLDTGVLRQALAQQKLPIPKSPIMEWAHVVSAIGSLAVPLGSMYWAHKDREDAVDRDIRLREIASDESIRLNNSNNGLYNSVFSTYTQNYRNETVVWPPEESE